MAAVILTIADALVTAINGHVFSAPYDTVQAQRHYATRFKLEELSELKVTVIPPARSLDLIARKLAEGDFTLGVALTARTDGTDEDLDALVLLAQELGLFCLDADLGDAHAYQVDIDPLYDAALLREERTFSSVFLVSFKQGLAL